MVCLSSSSLIICKLKNEQAPRPQFWKRQLFVEVLKVEQDAHLSPQKKVSTWRRSQKELATRRWSLMRTATRWWSSMRTATEAI